MNGYQILNEMINNSLPAKDDQIDITNTHDRSRLFPYMVEFDLDELKDDVRHDQVADEIRKKTGKISNYSYYTKCYNLG